jgi:N6-adenosine-specific RNA methylase IME4
MKKNMSNIVENWYQKLLADLKKLAFEGIVKTKWLIGRRIIEDELKFDKPEYGSRRIENLAKDLKGSAAEFWACVRFAKKFPKLSDSIRELSWFEIEHKYLYEPRPKSIILPLPTGKYNIIYADPPWEYWAGGYKNQSQHYDVMNYKEIMKMPIQDISADNCILFMWATFPAIEQALEVIKMWGFKYSTIGFVWIKSKQDGTGFAFGLGNWTRANAEICLIAVKGSIERKDKSISQIIYTPLEEHSKKPDIVRGKIIQLVGDLPRIELFARQKTNGWDSWGQEI